MTPLCLGGSVVGRTIAEVADRWAVGPSTLTALCAVRRVSDALLPFHSAVAPAE
jgi:hypothetical protein